MIAGPSALLIALFLIPGWLYWKFEGSPRTSRSALAETFEVLVVSAIALALAGWAYIAVESHWSTSLADPISLIADVPKDQLVRTLGSLAVLLGLACVIAVLGVAVQALRRSRTQGGSTYHPDKTLWNHAFEGQREPVVTVEVKSGRQYTGYLVDYEMTSQGATPPIILEPPISMESDVAIGSKGRERRVVRVYRQCNVVIPGSEIVAVWVPREDSASPAANDA